MIGGRRHLEEGRGGRRKGSELGKGKRGRREEGGRGRIGVGWGRARGACTVYVL